MNYSVLFVVFANLNVLCAFGNSVSNSIDILKVNVDNVYLNKEPIIIELNLLFREAKVDPSKAKNISSIYYVLHDMKHEKTIKGALNNTMSVFAQKEESMNGEFIEHDKKDRDEKYMKTYQINLTNLIDYKSINNKIRVEVFYADEESISRIVRFKVIPGWCTLLPVVFVVLIATLTGHSLMALSGGVFVGSTFINGFNPILGFIKVLDTYTVDALGNSDNVKIVLFTFYLAGMVRMILDSGGAKAMVNLILKIIKKPTTSKRKSLQVAIYILGLLIFFDDYASCLIVGSNLQPVLSSTFTFISLEKFAYIVHATSSPLSAIIPISSWMGFEVGLISNQLKKYMDIKSEPFFIFLNSLKYCFFPIISVLLCLIIILMNKDFGPMLNAEKAAVSNSTQDTILSDKSCGDCNNYNIKDKDNLETINKKKESNPKFINALFPIVIIITGSVASLFVTGYYNLLQERETNNSMYPNGFSLADLAGKGDPYSSLLYSSFLSCFLSWFFYKFQKLMTFKNGITSFIEGIKEVIEPLLTLVLAWAIGIVFSELKCANYIISLVNSSSVINSSFESVLPMLMCMIACIIAFSTGSSWGTMSVMFPLAIPVALSLSHEESFLTMIIGAIISGALFGDQSSPISDTSIITTLACKVSVKKHCLSQLPYTLLAIFTSLVFGHIATGLNIYPWYVALLVSSVFMSGFMVVFGASPLSINSKSKFTLLINYLKSNLVA